MNKQNFLNQLKKDFSFLKPQISKGEIHSILLYGSWAKGMQTKRSDIDVCIVAPKCKSLKKKMVLLRYVWRNLKKPYDVRLFEDFPLYIQIDIIENHKEIYSRNYLELSYYFYFYRKLWQDQALHRVIEI